MDSVAVVECAVCSETYSHDYFPLPDNLKGHNRSITSCAFSPDGQLLLTSSTDSMSILWKLETRGILAMYTNCDIG